MEEKLSQQLVGLVKDYTTDNQYHRLSSVSTDSTKSDYSMFDDKVIPSVTIAEVDTTHFKLTCRQGTDSIADLARRWHISLEMAQLTIDGTTQKGGRDIAHMKGARQLQHLTQQLQYRPLNARCYTDTMLAVVLSLFNKYTCAQVYVNKELGWTKIYPMRMTSDNQFVAFRDGT
jgi:hypothetical protein